MSPPAVASVPAAMRAAPTATSDAALQVSALRDCHQLPTDQATVAEATTTLASEMDMPRMLVSISGTKPSTAKKAADSKNADAAAAGIPGRARKVPGGTMRARAGRPMAMP